MKKITITTDVRIACDPPHHIYQMMRYSRLELNSEEWWAEYAKKMNGWVSEFESFIRDHRSQDPVNLSVERVREDVCSSCLNKWEPTTDEDGTHCAHCGEPLDAEPAAARREGADNGE